MGPLFVRGGPGDDVVHLAKGMAALSYGNEWSILDSDPGHDTVFGFGKDDFIELIESSPGPAALDTNGDGRLDRKDSAVTVRNGDMTIKLATAYGENPDGATVTLVGLTSLSLSRIIDLSDD